MSYDTKERSIITYLSSPKAPRRASVPVCNLMKEEVMSCTTYLKILYLHPEIEGRFTLYAAHMTLKH